MMNRFRNSPARGHRPETVAAPVTKEEVMKAIEQYNEQKRNGRGSRRNSSGSTGNPEDATVINDAPKSNHNQDLASEDIDCISMTNSYSGEWEKLFMRPEYYRLLKHFGMTGKLRSSRFRSVCWKRYLEVLPEKRENWIRETRTSRKYYSDLKQKLIINPRKSVERQNLSVNNPLSQETESPWNQFFVDNELRLTIKQDVIRTFPELEFFKSLNLRERMISVLFCFAKQNSKLNYKQGMHELLAPLIFVLHCDHQAFLHACEIESIEDVVKEIMNPDYIEHDAFAMFCQIMETVEPWYVSKEISPTIKSSDILSSQPFARPQDLNPSNAIITKLTRIQDYVLKRFDPDLHAFLEKMDIPPQIYGIRWVRLLFGREFPMQDLLVLWDSIFADGISFDLVDYVFVAMLLYIREHMMTSDYATCLTTLMKYPPVGDIHYFITKAIYLREPNQYPRPQDYFYVKPPSQGGDGRMWMRARHTRGSAGSIAEKAANVMSMSFSSFTRKFSQSQGRPRSLKIGGSPQRMSKSTSEPMNLLTDQSPDYESPDVKRGSTASLSKLEDNSYMSEDYLRPTMSSSSLARLETSSVRSAPSMTGSPPSRSRSELNSPAEEKSSPPFKYNTLPTPRKGDKKGKGKIKQDTSKQAKQERETPPEVSYLLGRLNDMESMCRGCADKMDRHIDKLQCEMLRQDLENEDELLLALAGLKQVRDVLKGILKPTSILDPCEIHIKENHYQDETPSSIDLTPGSQNSYGVSPIRYPRSTFFPSNSVETSSDPDSSSPENQENVRHQQQAHLGGSRRGSGSSRHSSQSAKISRQNYNYHPNPQEEHVLSKSTLQKLINKAEIELQEFKNKTVSKQMSHEESGSHYDNHSSSHRRSYSAGNHSVLPPDSDSNLYDSNRNSRGKISNEPPYKISYNQ